MLWTELQRVVTRDGQTLAGAEVRDWLEARTTIPGGGGPDVEIETNAAPQILLRTREEVAQWLTEVMLCKVVELGPAPVAAAPQRVAARGQGVQNRNDAPVRVEFLDHRTSLMVARVTVQQARCVRVKVRVNPAPRRAARTLELAFIGAKIRSRAAIRSVRDSTTGYRYLSRVRVATADNGIATPLLGLHQGVVSTGVPRWTNRNPHQDVHELTLMGLEAGTERLQACLLDGAGRVQASAVLEIVVTRAATDVGALRVVALATVADYVTADPEFDSIYALSGTTAAEARVGVCDSGVYDDAATANAQRYLDRHWIAGKYFDSDVGVADDRDTKPGPGHAQHVLDESPSMHGTNVAGQAVWGSPRIRLVDVMVQRGQETGMMTDAAAERAFRWADQQGVCVVNCSKIMPFRGDQTNAFVSDPATVGRVLFLATGGNSRRSFPLNNTPDTLVLQGEVNAGSLPTSMQNTLWVGGCKTDRTPHDSRGYGPAIEVMVPSDRQSLYSPDPLREAFRAQKIGKFRNDVISELARRDAAIVNPPQRIAGSLSNVKRMQLQDLERREAALTPPATLIPRDALKLQQLRNEAADAPNPAFETKQAYNSIHAEVSGWPHANLLTWADQIITLRDDLASDAAAQQSATVRVQAIRGQARDAVYEYLRNAMQILNIVSHRDALREVRQAGGHIGSDEGVSFGLPIVANVVAKLKLINSNLTPNQLKRIIIDTSDIVPGFEPECIARGIINPLRAYLAAYDNEVSAGGSLHHDYRATVTAIPEPRRVYYSFFYMDSEGLALYDAIRQRLKDSYAAMNIDLVEAEPPIAIPNEPLTYVEGPAILGHTWTSVVPAAQHPLIYPGRQLRLVLVNETALVIGSALAGTLEGHALNKDPANAWIPEVAATDKVTINNPRFLPTGRGAAQAWTCVLTIPNTPELARYTFVDNPDHIVTGFMPLGPGPQAGQVEINRVNDRRVNVVVRDAALNLQLAAAARISFSVGVVQRLGGARKGRNIFVNNKYHRGPTGTPEARNSALVLFQHEIGHALGMVNPVGHAHYYNRTHGGEGDHCAFNTENKTNAEAAGYGLIGDGASGSIKVPLAVTDAAGHRDDVPCVMYHTRSPAHSRSVFCAECIRHLRDVIDPATWRWNSDR